jgi:hypothetical protein
MTESISPSRAIPSNTGQRYIFVWSASVFSRLLSPLARTLRRNHNIETILFTYGDINLPSPKIYDFDRSDFAEIVDVMKMMKPREKNLPGNSQIAEQANGIERRLGVNIVDLIRTDRHLGIGFVTGADFHTSAYGESANYPQTLDIALRLCAGFEDLTVRYKPEAALVFPGSIATAALASIVKSKGVPWRWLVPSPVDNLFYWCEEQAVKPIGFAAAYEKRLKELKDRRDGREELKPDQNDSTPVRAQMHFSSSRNRTKVIYLYRQIYKILRTDLAHRVKRPGLTIYGRYKALDKIRQVLERWFWLRRELGQPSVTTEIPNGTPFIYYPLHIEPESTLMVEAQHSDNQLLVVDWLSKAAPPGWYVVVKEHPGATARRPKGFWERVKSYPNIVVAPTFGNSLELVEQCRAVADINGSVGQQAAARGIPVVTFNKTYIATVMPHVLAVESYSETRDALRRVRDNNLPDMQTRLLAAEAFSEATKDRCIPVNDTALIQGVPGRTLVADEEILHFSNSLLASLPNFEPKQASK